MELRRATEKDSHTIWKIQTEAFAELLTKYEDYDTSPGNETVESIRAKLLQPYTYFYFIIVENNAVGAIRIIDMKDGSRKRIAPLFIIKETKDMPNQR